MTPRSGRLLQFDRSVPPAARPAPGAAVAMLLAVASAGLVSSPEAAGEKTPEPSVPVVPAMAGTERYCTGYEQTFHGQWAAGTDGRAADAPVLFRIGVNPDGKGCYAQLSVMSPPGIAPYELPRFRAEVRDGGVWSLRYRDFDFEIDAGRGTATRLRDGRAIRAGVLLERSPPVGEDLPVPSAERRARWYGKWRGRISRLPFRVTLQLTESSTEEVEGRISTLLMKRNFTGRFHGEMLVFRWRNRHVGLVMEPEGDALVYTDYRRRVFRFRRRG